MSEVEALCDRVGILRDGKLIEMGTLAEMRHLSALTRRGHASRARVPDPSLGFRESARWRSTDGSSAARCGDQSSPLLKVLAPSASRSC